MNVVVSLPIGRLSLRMTLEREVRVADGGGGASVTWEPVGEMWAAVEAQTGAEKVRADRVTGEVNATVTIRYRDDVAPAMRFRIGRKVYDILAVLDGDGYHRFLRCQCQRRDL